MCFRKEVWIMDPSSDKYYRWLSIIAAPVFYNLMMLVTRSVHAVSLMTSTYVDVWRDAAYASFFHISSGPVLMSFRTLTQCFGSSWTILQTQSTTQTHLSDQEQVWWLFIERIILMEYLLNIIHIKTLPLY